jgi:hypothetical protein
MRVSAGTLIVKSKPTSIGITQSEYFNIYRLYECICVQNHFQNFKTCEFLYVEIKYCCCFQYKDGLSVDYKYNAYGMEYKKKYKIYNKTEMERTNCFPTAHDMPVTAGLSQSDGGLSGQSIFFCPTLSYFEARLVLGFHNAGNRGCKKLMSLKRSPKLIIGHTKPNLEIM